jgi:hypothetical protein
VICAACGLNRDPDDLIAFWPVGYPDRVRFVCRVTRPSPVAQESCFRAVVASVAVHQIAAANYALGGPMPRGPVATIVGESGPERIAWVGP